jgi:hypothetical protein
MATWLRIAGISLNALGAIILAFRMKGILDTLVLAQEANDINFRLLIDIISGGKQTIPLVVGMNEQVSRKQKVGIWLLVAGFSCIAIGNLLVGASWYVELHGISA